jgi:glycosyltransferase involved in cell wall biosynthesis
MHVVVGLLTLAPGRATSGEQSVRGLLGEFARGNGPERVTALVNRDAQTALADVFGGPLSPRLVRAYRPGRRAPARALAVAAARALPTAVNRAVPDDADAIHFPLTVGVPPAPVPWVVTTHDLLHHDLPALFPREQQRYRRWTYDAAARRARAVIAVSGFTRDRLIERVGVAPERVTVVAPGVEHDRFRPEDDDDERRLAGLRGLPRHFVIYPAHLWHHKNHEALLRGLAAADDRSVELVLTGHVYGRLRGLLERASQLGLAERVHHLGYVPDAAMPALYRRATAMVFPSLYEGFGLPPLEAMACGCPIAASMRGALDETCGQAALAFDPDDPDSVGAAIDAVAGDDDLRARLRTAGLRHAAKFTWREAAARHAEVYARAAAAG